MAKLPEPMHTHTTATAIFKWYEKKQEEELPRPYLGASIIGEKCKRSLWYNFRQVKIVRFEGRMLRLFDTGQREEVRFVEELRGIGCEVYEKDPDTGEQFEIKAIFGHFSGHLDGIGRGMPEGQKAWAVLEFKTHNAKSFADLQKNGVKKSKPKHYAQMQVYMLKQKFDRALYLARDKDTDNLYTEWVHLDKEYALSLIDKAESIIFANTPPDRLSDDPAYWECKFCDFYGVCHQQEPPLKNCRTCCKATPCAEGDSGEWLCERWKDKIPFDVQINGCDEHLFIPPLISYATPVDAGDNWVEYEHSATGKRFVNGCQSAIDDPDIKDSAQMYSSDELAKLPASMVAEEFIDSIKGTFPGAEVVEVSVP